MPNSDERALRNLQLALEDVIETLEQRILRPDEAAPGDLLLRVFRRCTNRDERDVALAGVLAVLVEFAAQAVKVSDAAHDTAQLAHIFRCAAIGTAAEIFPEEYELALLGLIDPTDGSVDLER